MKTAIACIVFLVATAAVYGQDAPKPLSAAEAQEKLAEKARQRDIERGELIRVTKGELDDLKAKVAALEAEVRTLRGTATTRAAAAKKPRTEIEPGMTRDEVVKFAQFNGLRHTGTSMENGAGGKQEVMRFARIAKGQRQTGTRRDGLGRLAPVYEGVDNEVGQVVVTIVNGVVERVTAN